MYLPGDAVLITDIGEFNTENRTNPGTSLVCVTSNVNTKCCRKMDEPNNRGNVGEWYFPNDALVPRNGGAPTGDFTRSGFAQQVRLNRRNSAASPTGTYVCRVPDGSTGMLMNASIILGLYMGICMCLSCAHSAGDHDHFLHQWIRSHAHTPCTC